MSRQSLVHADAWQQLRRLTPARIALGRAGSSLPTSELLDFQLAHARARDAVHADFDSAGLAEQIARLGVETVCLKSGAASREIYLQRPDLGRQLDDASRARLAEIVAPLDRDSGNTINPTPVASPAGRCDLAIIVSDGLSALAAQRQVVPLLAAWLPLLGDEKRRLAPITIVARGRVAIEDEIGFAWGAKVAVILIGERPGLGSPDSLGAYLAFHPRPGLHDADRNCVSNIRPQGLPPLAAAMKLHYLFRESLSRQLSGVGLKDESRAIASERNETGAPPSLPGL